MPDDLPQPKDEYWLPSLRGPVPARNIPQYRPPKKGRTVYIIFTIGSAVAVVLTLLIPGYGVLIAVNAFGLAVLLNVAVWLTA